MNERRCFSEKNSLALWLLPRTGRASRPLSSVFRHGRTVVRGRPRRLRAPISNNLNNKQFVSYFRIMGYGAGKVDDVAAQANQAHPVGRALPGSAKRKAVCTLEGTGQSGPLGAGWPDASAARHRQGWHRVQPGGELIERRNFFNCFPAQPFEKVQFEKINASYFTSVY